MSKIIPLSMPEDLLAEARRAAKLTHLSMQDVFRQSMRLGMPRLCEQLADPGGRLTNVEPLPKKVLAEIYSRPERDEEGIDQLIAAQPKEVRD